MYQGSVLSWVTPADLVEPASGPIAAACRLARFHQMTLLVDDALGDGSALTAFLEAGGIRPNMRRVSLDDPFDFVAIYEAARDALMDQSGAHDDRRHILVNVGTAMMGTCWILLAKTLAPSTLLHVSRERGLVAVSLPLELSSRYLPDLIQALDQRRSEKPGRIVASSPAMRRVLDMVHRAAARDLPVLILGESGTGKEILAHEIHRRSLRRKKSMETANCAAIPTELFASECFGHVKGSFTGAHRDHAGLFQRANGGTLFLDEIGDLSRDNQVVLLRALENGRITPVGADRTLDVDVRLICATHCDLHQQIEKGQFRHDLFYRIAVAVIRIPPLRERLDDLNALIEQGVRRLNVELRGTPGFKSRRIAEGALQVFRSYGWPGNVRELHNVLERIFLWSDCEVIDADEAKRYLSHRKADPLVDIPSGFDLKAHLDHVATRYVSMAAEKSNTKAEAARMLGFRNYQTYDNWRKRLGINSDKHEVTT